MVFLPGQVSNQLKAVERTNETMSEKTYSYPRDWTSPAYFGGFTLSFDEFSASDAGNDIVCMEKETTRML